MPIESDTAALDLRCDVTYEVIGGCEAHVDSTACCGMSPLSESSCQQAENVVLRWQQKWRRYTFN